MNKFSWKSVKEELFKPVDIASMAMFRVMFGAVMLYEVFRFFDNGWIAKYYINPDFYFKYYGFSWVEPWGGDGMYIHFAVMGVLAVCIMLGLFYRITSILFFLGFTFWFLLDQTRYLNHLYLVSLISFMMTLFPVHKTRSLDVKLKPQIASNYIPAWCLWLMRFQVGLVYFYAGIAKLNHDWFRGAPIGDWLKKRGDYPIIGPFLETDFAVLFFGHGGTVFDLLVAPALLWKKTRIPAFIACLFFHSINKVLFNIGIFPITMVALTLLFFEPDWPRKVNFLFGKLGDNVSKPVFNFSKRYKTAVLSFLIVWASIQILFPLRHWLYPGNVHWTEEGHRFAWHMKLRSKRANVKFIGTDPATGKSWIINHRKYLTTKQKGRVGRFPDMSLQMVHFLESELQKEGYGDIEIRVHSLASLNGRKPEYIIDPKRDISVEKRNLWHADWIMPMTEPLPSN